MENKPHISLADALVRVVRYFIEEWLIFILIFGVVAIAFKDSSVVGWAILGGILGKWWREE